MYRVWNFLSTYSLLLIIGAVIALFWANIDHASYLSFVDFHIWDHNSWIGHAHYDATGALEYRSLTLTYLINDILMALFFAMAGKEVWEALALKDGSLSGSKALTPLIATVGGMFGPILVYLTIASLFGSTTFDAIKNGWAVPTATDIAFSYLVARFIFGANHPAIRFLLLLAIADDAGGLIILAIFYPQAPIDFNWLLVAIATAVFVYLTFNYAPKRLDGKDATRPYSTKIRKALGGLPYVIGGIICWFGFQNAGIHPALGLLPIIPAIPHADRDFGLFSDSEKHQTDLLNMFEHILKVPVQIILFFFGLCNAGVVFSSIGPATWAVVGGLFIGKPIGIFVFGFFAAKILKLGLPSQMNLKDLFIVGLIASIGFTVSLFVAVAAFKSADPAILDAAKMGALFSFGGAIIAITVARLIKVKANA